MDRGREIAEAQRQQERKDYAKEVVGRLADKVNTINSSNIEKLAIELGNALYNQHRTLQQSIVRMLPLILTQYVGMCEKFGTDMRNDASHKYCKKITEIDDVYLPYV